MIAMIAAIAEGFFFVSEIPAIVEIIWERAIISNVE